MYVQGVYTFNTLALVPCVKMHQLLCELHLIFGPSLGNQVYCLIFLDSTPTTDGHFINIAKCTLAGFISNFTVQFSVSDNCVFS